MYGVVINCDTAATISGDSPLFYTIGNCAKWSSPFRIVSIQAELR